MIVLALCFALTIVVGQVESNGYSYSVPQRPCSGGNFCGGHPNSLPFEPRYPSVRVGVSPGYSGEPEGNYESNETPDNSYSVSAKEQGNYAPPPSSLNDENQLPVSVCVQLPPKTPLKLSKSILQQIIFSLTEGNSDVDPVVEPALPEPVTLPVYSAVQPPGYAPPQAALPAPQQPIYSSQPSYLAPPPAYAETPVYPPQPLSPVEPSYDPEPIGSTPPSIPAIQTPRYPTYETGPTGQQVAYVQPPPSRPGSPCYSCGSSLKPRYNQKR